MYLSPSGPSHINSSWKWRTNRTYLNKQVCLKLKVPAEQIKRFKLQIEQDGRIIKQLRLSQIEMRNQSDHFLIDLEPHLQNLAGKFTLNLVRGILSVLSSPIQFSVLPDIEILEFPHPDAVYHYYRSCMVVNIKKDQKGASVIWQLRFLYGKIARLVQESSLLRDLIIAAGFGIVIGIATLFSPYVALALILGLVGGYILIPRPIWAVYLLLGAIALTSGIPRGCLIPVLKLNEVVLVVVLGIAFLAYTVSVERREMPGWLIFACVLLIAGTAITPIISYYARNWPLSVSDLMRFVAPAQYPLLFWIFANFPNNDTQRERVLQIIFLMASVIALVGLLLTEESVIIEEPAPIPTESPSPEGGTTEEPYVFKCPRKRGRFWL